MKFNVGVNFRMTSNGSKYSSKSDRSHVIAHAKRYKNKNVQYYKNNNVDLRKSILNDQYETQFSNVYDVLKDRFLNKALTHDLKERKHYNYKRCYGDKEKHISPIDGYLGKYVHQGQPRWLKPLRTVPFKFCTMTEKAKLIQLCLNRGLSYQQYAQIVNRGYRNYVDNFNKKNKHMKITMSLTNLDEPGGDHSHIEYIGLGTTKGGKPSMSFNRAVAQTIKGHAPSNYSKAMSKFREQQSNNLLKSLSKSFKTAGLNINFKMVSHARNPKTYINNLAVYKQAMNAVDQAKAKEANAKANKVNYENQAKINQAKADKSFQRLNDALASLQKQNIKLAKRNERLSKQRPKILRSLMTKLTLKYKIHTLKQTIKKLKTLNKLTQQACLNRLKTALANMPKKSTLVAQSEKLKKRNIYLRHLNGIHNVKIMSLQNYNHTLQARVTRCKNQLNEWQKNLNIMIRNNNNWSHSLSGFKEQALQLSRQQQRINQQLPTLRNRGKILERLSKLSATDLAELLRLSEVNGNRQRNGYKSITLGELKREDQNV